MIAAPAPASSFDVPTPVDDTARAIAAAKTSDDAFAASLRFTLHMEGGYANNPNDPGGATMRGVTQRVYDAYRRRQSLSPVPVRDIADAELLEIYRRNYWMDASCDRIAGVGKCRTALAHFDAAVNCGTRQAAKLLQRALYVTDDGVIGPITIGAVQQHHDELVLVSLMLERRAEFYRTLANQRPSLAEFLPDWLARCRWVARATGASIAPNFRSNA